MPVFKARLFPRRRFHLRTLCLGVVAALTMALSSSVGCGGGPDPVDDSPPPSNRPPSNTGENGSTSTNGTPSDNVGPGTPNGTGNGGNVVVPEKPPEIVDPSGVRWQWSQMPPRFAATSPFRSTVTVAAPVPISRVTLDGVAIATPQASEFSVTVEIDVQTAAPDHAIRLFADAGETIDAPVAELAFRIIWDTDAPTAAVVRPSAEKGHTVFTRDAQMLVQATIYDDGELAAIRVAGEEIPVAAGASEATIEKLVTLAEGSQELRIEAQDAAGNTATWQWTVVRDATPPTIEFTGPNPGQTTWATEDETTTLTGVVRDPAGVDRLDIAGDAVELTGEPTAREFRATVALEPGTNIIECRARDVLGNETRIALTVLRGSVEEMPSPTEMQIPPPPDSRFGVMTVAVTAEGDTAQEVIDELQLKALVRHLTAEFGTGQTTVRTSSAAQVFARTLHVRVREWSVIPGGWGCEADVVIGETELLRFLTDHGAELSEAVPSAVLGPPVLVIPRESHQWHLAAVAATPTTEAMALVWRNGPAVRVQIQSVASGAGAGAAVVADSRVQWSEVTRAAMLPDGSAVYVFGRDTTNARRAEEFAIRAEAPTIRPMPALATGAAFHPTTPQAVVVTGAKLQILDLPGGAVAAEFDAPPQARPIGFDVASNAIVVIGNAIDDFGVATPGTIFVFDAATKALRSTYFRQAELLSAAPDFAPPATVIAGDLAAVNQQLAAAFSGQLAADASVGGVALPTALLPLDFSTGRPAGPIVPDRVRARLMGPNLRADVSADGRLMAINGGGRGVLYDVRTGTALLEIAGAIRLPAQGKWLVVASDTATGIFAAPTNPEAWRAMDTEARLQSAIQPGVTLVLTVTPRVGEEITGDVAQRLHTALERYGRLQGYRILPGTRGSPPPSDAKGRLLVETWHADGRVDVRISLALGSSGPARWWLGSESELVRADESPAAAFDRLLGKLLARLAPLPARLHPLPEAAFDLPRRVAIAARE